jgi:hypothetical protein
MRNFLSTAKVLDDLILDLREKKVDIPSHVVDSLKAGRSLANVVKLNCDDMETAMKTQSALEIVEMNLLSMAEAAFGSEYADSWQRKIAQTYQEEPESVAKKQTFVTGVPKGNHWVRYETKDLFEVEGTEQRISEHNLKFRNQDDGFTLIYGKKEDVSAFLSVIREEYRQRIRKVGV